LHVHGLLVVGTWLACAGCFSSFTGSKDKEKPASDDEQEVTDVVPSDPVAPVDTDDSDDHATAGEAGGSGGTGGQDDTTPDAAPAPYVPVASAPDGFETVPVELEDSYDFIGSIIGDLDGDGVGDLVLSGYQLSTMGMGPPEEPPLSAGATFIFYGGEDIGSSLAVSDADAVLRGAVLLRQEVPDRAGDLNGDGLFDLVLHGGDTVCFVFGTESRLAGEHAIADVAKVWNLTDADAVEAAAAFAMTLATGDVQNDGLADFLLTVFPSRTPESGPVTVTTYLVSGRADEWPAGDFDPAWTTAQFAMADEATSVEGHDAGDVNGDGSADLLLNVSLDPGIKTVFVPGGSQPLTGRVSLDPSQVLVDEDGWSVMPQRVSDTDGDGSDELWWYRSSGIDLAFGRAGLGEQNLVPDVQIDGRGLQLGHLSVVDLDADGTRELVLGTTADEPGTPSGLYVFPADKLRSATQVDLNQEKAWWQPDGSNAEQERRPSLEVHAGGDLNGDGASDLVFTVTDTVSFEPEAPRASIRVALSQR
jgi:hypothetical protein